MNGVVCPRRRSFAQRGHHGRFCYIGHEGRPTTTWQKANRVIVVSSARMERAKVQVCAETKKQKEQAERENLGKCGWTCLTGRVLMEGWRDGMEGSGVKEGGVCV